MDLERPLHYRREGKVNQVRGFVHQGFEGLKIISAGKDGGREGVPDDKTVIISKNKILSMFTY